MMRNPFRLRAAQRAVSDEEFVRLFGSGALDLLNDVGDPWRGVVFLRSAPGGGKTSVLRLLTPRPLRIAAALRDDEWCRPTYDALREHGAIGDDGPGVLGVFVGLTNEYRDLEEVDRGGSMFRALLNARIVIATVRALLDRSDRAYPSDLDSVNTAWLPESDSTIPNRASGKELFEWASGIERGFYEELDSLRDVEHDRIGHTRLDALKWFANATLRDAHGAVDLKRVLLLDDLQFLSDGQRRALTDTVVQARENCGVWIAERMEALSHQELLSEGALESRDYEGVIQLENKWSRRLPAYTKFVGQIADLRARRADGFNDRELFPLIAEADDEARWRDRFQDEERNIKNRIMERVTGNDRYKDWLRKAEAGGGSAFERAKRWRETEILVERDLANRQGTFDFDILGQDDYENRTSGAIGQAAELFLRRELAAPYYFGKETLAAVSSTNVDQYVEVTGDLFEEISASVAGPRSTPPSLSSERQDALIHAAAERRWSELPRRLPHGYEARKLLDAISSFCQAETYRPTAPYAPGVTGFAVTMRERERLISDEFEGHPDMLMLRHVLSTLLAHNLLTPRLDHRNKGRNYLVFYLNRLVCVRFHLPLRYGGWRAKSLDELCKWLSVSPRPSRELRRAH